MKIVFAGLEHTNYNPKAGKSFEYNNFLLAMQKLPGVEVVYFPFERIQKLGREKGNEELVRLVREERPDIFFAFMFTDELLVSTLDEIKMLTTSIGWFSDDHWRFDNYSRHYARHFSFVATTYSKAVARYKKIGQPNVILSQWTANTNLYLPTQERQTALDCPDVCFVGGWSKPRQKIITALSRAGINVATFGGGWPGGRVSDAQMIRLFGVSKINLALNPAPGFLNKNSIGRLWYRRSMDRIVHDWRLWDNLRCFFSRGIAQIKGRHFEIPACGGFMMTGPADNLSDYLVPGKEVVLYQDERDLVEKVKYYLRNEKEREQIAQAGYQRVVKDHSTEKRFKALFAAAGKDI